MSYFSQKVVSLCSSLMVAPFASANFVDDFKGGLELRNFYYNRDFRNEGATQSKRDEWAQGFIVNLQSGFTDGTVGFGVDAHAYSGWELDSGGGRAGKARLLGVDNEGHPKDEFSRGGAVAKLRFSSTELRYGEQRVKTPVFASSDSRLLPETATGWLLTSRELPATTLFAGHFNESTDRNASSHDRGFVVNYSNGRQGDRFDLVGVRNTAIKGLSASVFSAVYEDTWRQHYLGAVYTRPLFPGQALTVDLTSCTPVHIYI